MLHAARIDREDPQAPAARLRIRLEEEVIFEQTIEVNFQQELLNRLILQFQGFVVPHPGMLKASLEVDGQTLDSYRMAVVPGHMAAPAQSH